MATSDKLTENYLTCTICAEVFTNPTTLHCDHTFCRPCLVTYIKTQPDAIQAKFIPCPSCRQITIVTSPEKSVEDWVNQVKPSRLIRGLMEDFGPGCDTKDPNTCDVCQKEGETTSATCWCTKCGQSFCDNCLRMHRRFAATSLHEVTPLSGETKQRKKTRFLCTDHDDEQIKLFCKDCNTAICHICCSISHRQCLSVVTLETVMNEVTVTLEENRNALEKKIKFEFQQLVKHKEQIDEVTRNVNVVESEIKQATINILDEIRKKERKLLDDLAKQTEEMRESMKSREITMQEHQQQFELLDLALKSETQKDMFAIYESWRESVDDTEDTEDILAVDRIVFKQNRFQLIKTLLSLQVGKVNVISDVKYRTSTIFSGKYN